MKVILGLGNPGRQYEATRHNVGWWVLDHLADVWHFDGWKRDGEALVSNASVAGVRVRLIKPHTYMLFALAFLAWPLVAALAFGLGLGDTWLDLRTRAQAKSL